MPTDPRVCEKSPSLAPPAHGDWPLGPTCGPTVQRASGGAWGDASPQTPAKHGVGGSTDTAIPRQFTDPAADPSLVSTLTDWRFEPPIKQTSRGQRLAHWVFAATIALVVAILAGFALVRARPPATATSVRPAPPRAANASTWMLAHGLHTLVHQLIRAPWGVLYAATAQGISSSADDGGTWRGLGQDFPGPGIAAWGVVALRGPGGDAVLATGADGFVYRLPRAGSRWTRATTHIGTYATAIYALPGGVVLAGSDGGIYRSTDGRSAWTQAARISGGAVAAFARDPVTGAIYAGLAGLPASLRVSADDGRSWRVPVGVLPPPSVEALLALPGHVYAGVMGARQPVWTGAARGFASVGRGLSSDVHGMALAALDDNEGRGLLFLGSMGTGVYMAAYASLPATVSGKGVVVSRGYGPWVPLGRAPGDGVVTALLALPGAPGGRGAPPTLLVGTSEGVYRLRLPRNPAISAALG